MNLLIAHPYQGAHFFSFFSILCARLRLLFCGGLSWQELASDEVQLFVLLGVGVSAALVGCPLVLRRMAMMANSLSHTVLLGIVLAYALFGGSNLSFAVLLTAAFISGGLTVLLTECLVRVARVREDAANGLVFSTLFSLGVVLATLLTRNAHIGLETVMGNADALHYLDIKPVVWVFLLNGALTLLFYKEIQCLAFDRAFAVAAGLPTRLASFLLMVQLSVTSIAAFRAVGVIVVLAFLVAPALFARLFARSFAQMLLIASLCAAVVVSVGVALSRHLLVQWGIALSTSGIVTCILGFVFASGLVVHRLRLLTLKRTASALELADIQ